MSEHTAPASLAPDAARRLAEFARTCRAAARAVSLYPAGHPAVAASLVRLAEATGQVTAEAPYELSVHSEELTVGEAHLARPDAAVAELAGLLHRHGIGRLTLNTGVDAEAWRTFLLLLARPPEDVRADGGIAHLWTTAGGPSIDVREIDYADVLRERHGLAATIQTIIAAALKGPRLELDDEGMRALLEIVGDASKLKMLLEQLQQTCAEAPAGVELQTAGFLNLLRGLVLHVTNQTPEQLAAVFDQLGQGARHLSVDAMVSLLAERSGPGATAGALHVVSALVDHMSDATIAGFLADNVVAERGASERLAHAFRALVPELDRQRRLLALAREQTETEFPGGQEDFAELWQRVEGMLTTYTDSRYVSEDYARELSHARTQPVDVERTSDDPPERLAAWVATVSDSALRGLDRHLLGDLLAIETDLARWRDIADTVMSHADDLVRVGYFDQAASLIDTLAAESRSSPDRKAHAASLLDRFGRGSLMKHLPTFLRTADDEIYGRWKAICHTIGPEVVAPLAERLAAEQDARARRRLRDILVGFGPRGSEAVRPLMNAGSWEVRRTAAFLLREFGGTGSLKELIPLLSDAEPLVQREAVHALALNGRREASAILLNAVKASSGRTRETLLGEVLGMRDERAAGLFAHVLRELEPRSLPELYDTAIEALGTFGGDDAVPALETALRRGSWWTPLANRRFRYAAAQALRRLGTPAALEALRRASAHGRGSVRSAARAGLEALE
jgi:hypothetical protein